MNTNPVNNNHPSFTSRNTVVRKAQDVCNLVNREFVGTSFSRTLEITNELFYRKAKTDVNQAIAFWKKFEGFILQFQKKSNSMRFNISKNWHADKETIPTIQNLFTLVRKHKIINCGQRATLSEIVARMNGFKDAQKMRVGILEDGKGRALDHAVTVIGLDVPKDIKHFAATRNTPAEYLELYYKLPKKAIVIDSWMGFVDYAPNAIQKYKIDFAEELAKKSGEIRFYPYQDKKLINLSDNDISKLIKKNNNLLTGSVKKLISKK